MKGRLYWMRDGYTTSDAYPYSSQITLEDGTEFNYIRNSVKVVVDAYTGEVNVYTVEQPLNDPMIETYAKIFPGVFKPLSAMPADLRNHIRYPEDFFRYQTHIYKRYHQTDPVVYYNNSDLWDIPDEADLLKERRRRADGALLRDYEAPERRERGVHSDDSIHSRGQAEHGLVDVRQVRPARTTAGWCFTSSRRSRSTGRSRWLRLPTRTPRSLSRSHCGARPGRDRSVSSGNLLVIPIESSLLYVMPVYLEASSTKIPEVKRVIVALGNNVAMAPTLNEAIAQVVGAPVAVHAADGRARGCLGWEKAKPRKSPFDRRGGACHSRGIAV